MEKQLYVGYARLDVTPPLGVNLGGYFLERFADGVLDPLEAVATAVKQGDKTVLIIAIDHIGPNTKYYERARKAVNAATGVPTDAIFVSTTHTHTGPIIADNCKNELNNEYAEYLLHKIADAAVLAIADLAPARLGIGVGEAKRVAFIRRYKMKDGTIKTNPGVNNPDIVEPAGITDESVPVVRFDREGKETVVLINFANHPDVVGGNKISGDWPSLTRRFVEKAIDNTKCIMLNGAEGDVNHVNVRPTGGDFNDMFNDFDGCSRGYGHACHIARVITGAVLSVYDKVEYLDVDEISYEQRVVDIPSNKPTPEEMPLARKYHELHLAGRDDEIPYTAMMLTTMLADASRKVRLENAPDAFPMLFSAIKIGPVALFGIPGEPFNAVGRGVKGAEGYRLVIPCCLTNAKEGYFPMRDSYDEGGYEARSSSFKAGVAEKIIEVGVDMLEKLK